MGIRRSSTKICCWESQRLSRVMSRSILLHSRCNVVPQMKQWQLTVYVLPGTLWRHRITFVRLVAADQSQRQETWLDNCSAASNSVWSHYLNANAQTVQLTRRWLLLVFLLLRHSWRDVAQSLNIFFNVPRVSFVKKKKKKNGSRAQYPGLPEVGALKVTFCPHGHFIYWKQLLSPCLQIVFCHICYCAAKWINHNRRIRGAYPRKYGLNYSFRRGVRPARLRH